MEQGDIFSEGISLQDDSYDGQGGTWDRTVDLPMNSVDKDNSINIFHQPELNAGERNRSEGRALLLTGGLGQLTDKIEGGNSFTMDLGYGLGKKRIFPSYFRLFRPYEVYNAFLSLGKRNVLMIDAMYLFAA